jgi:gas vesicle protein
MKSFLIGVAIGVIIGVNAHQKKLQAAEAKQPEAQPEPSSSEEAPQPT